MTKAKEQKRSPYFGGGILTDSFSLAESGKINAQGIFTMFLAWDFPCYRRGIAIITLFDLPTRKTKVTISIKKKGFSAKRLTRAILKPKKVIKDSPPSVQSIPLAFTFTSTGTYQLLFSIPRIRNTLKIPFEVRKKTWPTFTKIEIKFAKTNPNCIKSIRANVVCDSCSSSYIFEESLLDEPPAGGVHRFPQSGKFKCRGPKCKYTLKLRDLQGRLRSSLKEQVKQAMKRRP